MSLKSYLKVVTLILAASLIRVDCHASTASAAPFEDGDRWTAVGDSITHGGTYYMWVYLYYATRFPEMELTVSNAGNSGDDADGTLERYDWDILPKDPTVVSVMLGMNDVRREIYGDMPITPQLIDQRTYILEGYRSFMTKLINRFEADDIRLILITPSIYDETAEHSREVLTGVNAALGECAEFVTEIAEEKGATLIDFYGPMNVINELIQAKDPSASLIKTDRVHPNPMGQFVMGYLFLKSVGASGLVSSVSIDASKDKVVDVANASLEDLAATPESVRFKILEKALPYPINKKEQLEALEWVPFQEEFNQELLQVTGLKSGKYTLTIDGELICDFDAEELAAGVNLALEANTPQAKQAADVLALMETWHKEILNARSIASFEFWSLGDLPHPVSLKDAQAQIEVILANLPDPDSKPAEWKRRAASRYLDNKPNEAKIEEALRTLSADIHAAAQPVSHVYQLERVR